MLVSYEIKLNIVSDSINKIFPEINTFLDVIKSYFKMNPLSFVQLM